MDYLGKDELSTAGVGFIKSDFDIVSKAMEKSITERLSLPLLNPRMWKYVGFNRGPINKWLTHYINTASELGEAYNKEDYPEWEAVFMDRYGYDDPEQLELYFSTFRNLMDSGRVPESIMEPWNYTQDFDTPFQSLAKKALTYALVGGGIYALIIYGAPTAIKRLRK